MVMIKKDQEKGNNQSQQEPLIGARPYIFQEVPRVPFENPYNNHSHRFRHNPDSDDNNIRTNTNQPYSRLFLQHISGSWVRR